MRRQDREIVDKIELIDMMRRCDVCRIALNDGGYPYIIPLNFGIEQNGDKASSGAATYTFLKILKSLRCCNL